MFVVIFGTDTRAGRNFDIVLLWLIVVSVFLVMLSTVKSLSSQYGVFFKSSEFLFTFLFTTEYALRIFSHPQPRKYIFSFYGLIDFLAIIPSYLEFLFLSSHYLFLIRALRLLRVFRVLKLGRYIKEAEFLLKALNQSMYKITVFFGAVLALVLFLGTAMYLIEGEESGFDSIPQSIYWAIVTITTVGYGDIAPLTVAGRIIASVAMLLGYSIIAVPTGIISVEMSNVSKNEKKRVRECNECGFDEEDDKARFCRECGAELPKVRKNDSI